MDGPLVVTRAVHLAATLLLTGGLAFQCFVAAPLSGTKSGAALEAHMRTWFARTNWTALAAALVSGAAWLVLLSAEIGEVPAAQALSEGWPWLVLTQTTFGTVWTVRLAMIALLAGLLLAPRARGGAFILDVISAALAASAAAAIAWTGHAMGMEGIDGAIHLTSDGLHLVAAGAWLGALWPLALLLAAADRAGDPESAAIARRVTQRFSVLGMICVAAILATGVVNTWEILGTTAFSLGTDYNRLLFAKIGLFFAMVAIAAFNRRRLTPQLSSAADRSRAMRQLRWNSLTETGLGLVILAIVAVLGRMTPHTHMGM